MKKRQIKAGELVYLHRGPGKRGFSQGIFLRNVGTPLFNDGDYICHIFTEGKKVTTVNSKLKLMDEHGNLLPWKIS